MQKKKKLWKFLWIYGEFSKKILMTFPKNYSKLREETLENFQGKFQTILQWNARELFEEMSENFSLESKRVLRGNSVVFLAKKICSNFLENFVGFLEKVLPKEVLWSFPEFSNSYLEKIRSIFFFLRKLH